MRRCAAGRRGHEPVIFEGCVYNVMSWAKRHPGGELSSVTCMEKMLLIISLRFILRRYHHVSSLLAASMAPGSKMPDFREICISDEKVENEWRPIAVILCLTRSLQRAVGCVPALLLLST